MLYGRPEGWFAFFAACLVALIPPLFVEVCLVYLKPELGRLMIEKLAMRKQSKKIEHEPITQY